MSAYPDWHWQQLGYTVERGRRGSPTSVVLMGFTDFKGSGKRFHTIGVIAIPPKDFFAPNRHRDYLPSTGESHVRNHYSGFSISTLFTHRHCSLLDPAQCRSSP